MEAFHFLTETFLKPLYKVLGQPLLSHMDFQVTLISHLYHFVVKIGQVAAKSTYYECDCMPGMIVSTAGITEKWKNW